MDNDIDEILSDIFSEENITERAIANQKAFEEKQMINMLRLLNMEDEAKNLKKTVKDKTGIYKLNFTIFYERYPDFPYWLFFRRLSYVYKITVAELFNLFNSAIFVRRWVELLSESPVIDKPNGLIFEWPGVSGKAVIIHNGSVNFENTELKMARRLGKGSRQLVWVERFIPFIENIKKSWKI